MAPIEEILNRRRKHARYDEELWSFADDVQGRCLEHLNDNGLHERLAALDKNIQYLDVGNPARDALPPERGWLSPWWWLRLRYWTLCEFDRRAIVPPQSSAIAPMPRLSPQCEGVIAGGRKLLIRISRQEWLLDGLRHGAVRLTPAAAYKELVGDEARVDDELRKSFRRSSSFIRMSKDDGTPIKPIGDVTFSSVRAIEYGDELVDTPYWMCSYSSDLDPRLFGEFKLSDPKCNACLIIFDPMEFVRRFLRAAMATAPLTTKSLFPIEYFDPYYPSAERLNVLSSKEMRYAYQREMRLVIDPEVALSSVGDGVLTLYVGSIADIAGVYSSDGARLDGVGPDSFLA